MRRIFIVSCNYNVKDLTNIIESNKKIINNSSNILYSIIDNNSTVEKTDFKSISNIIYVSLNKNIGKAKAINLLVNKLNEKYVIKDDDLIFSLDSDITITNPNFFKILEECYKLFDKNKICCLVCNQIGNNLTKRNLAFLNFNNIFNYFIPSEGFGYQIAGGGIIIPYKHWKAIKGYDETLGVNKTANIYSGADGRIMYNIFMKTDLSICLIKELEVFHPFDTDEGYKKWKEQQHKDMLTYGYTTAVNGFYDEKNRRNT